MTILNYDQYYKANQAFYRIFPFLSIMGSSAIIYMIVAEYYIQQRRGKFSRPTYQRIMIALCSNDIVFSLMFVLGPVMVPSSDEVIWAGGYGNTWTCSMQGVLIAVGGVLTSYWNATLMVYFLLTIRYSVSERNMSTKYEVWFYVWALIIFTSIVVPMLVAKVANPNVGIHFTTTNSADEKQQQQQQQDDDDVAATTTTTTTSKNQTMSRHEQWIHGNITSEEYGVVIMNCFVDPFPWACDNPDVNVDLRVECEHGQKEHLPMLLSGLLVVGICTMIIFSSFVVIYCTIRQKELATLQRFSFQGSKTKGESMKLTKKVQRQALLYGIFFMSAFVWLVLGKLYEMIWIELLMIAFQTSQGFFNFLIYSLPWIDRIIDERRNKQRQQKKDGQRNKVDNSIIQIVQKSIIEHKESIIQEEQKMNNNDPSTVVPAIVEEEEEEEKEEEEEEEEADDIEAVSVAASTPSNGDDEKDAKDGSNSSHGTDLVDDHECIIVGGDATSYLKGPTEKYEPIASRMTMTGLEESSCCSMLYEEEESGNQ